MVFEIYSLKLKKIQVQAAAGRTQQEDLSGAFLQMVNEANQNVKIRNLRRFAWLIEALGGALVGSNICLPQSMA